MFLSFSIENTNKMKKKSQGQTMYWFHPSVGLTSPILTIFVSYLHSYTNERSQNIGLAKMVKLHKPWIRRDKAFSTCDL
jgi:hypothetical protein